MEEENKNIVSDVGLILIGIILAIIILPILCGVMIAMIVGAVGWVYLSIIISTSVVIWTLMGLMWWI